MKRALICVLAAAVLLTLPSCNLGYPVYDEQILHVSKSAYLTPTDYYWNSQNPLKDMREYIEEHELTPDKPLYPQIYETEVLIGKDRYESLCALNNDYIRYRCAFPNNSGMKPFPYVIKNTPTKNIRVIGESVYLVYMLRNGARLYLFYRNGEYGGGYLTATPVLMMKKLSYFDFSGLRKGDDIRKAAAIDPVETEYKTAFDGEYRGEGFYDDLYTNWPWIVPKPLQSTHILTDGALRIRYTIEGNPTSRNSIPREYRRNCKEDKVGEPLHFGGSDKIIAGQASSAHD